MNEYKSIIFAFALGLSSLTSQSSVAACIKTGFTDLSSQTSAQVVIRINDDDGAVKWFCRTPNQRFAAAAHAAAANGARVTIGGEAAACPTIGPIRNIGACTLIIMPSASPGALSDEAALMSRLESAAAANEDVEEALLQFLEE